jgi:hypothetical protein
LVSFQAVLFGRSYALTCLFTNPHPSLDMIEAVEARDIKL